MTIQTFFLLRADLIPGVLPMDTVFVSLEIAAKEAAIPITFESLTACLTGYAVVVALPFEVLTLVHVRR